MDKREKKASTALKSFSALHFDTLTSAQRTPHCTNRQPNEPAESFFIQFHYSLSLKVLGGGIQLKHSDIDKGNISATASLVTCQKKLVSPEIQLKIRYFQESLT